MSLNARCLVIYIVLITLALLALTTWVGVVVCAFIGFVRYARHAIGWAERLATRTMRNQRRAQHPILVRWEDR